MCIMLLIYEPNNIEQCEIQSSNSNFEWFILVLRMKATACSLHRVACIKNKWWYWIAFIFYGLLFYQAMRHSQRMHSFEKKNHLFYFWSFYRLKFDWINTGSWMHLYKIKLLIDAYYAHEHQNTRILILFDSFINGNRYTSIIIILSSVSFYLLKYYSCRWISGGHRSGIEFIQPIRKSCLK